MLSRLEGVRSTGQGRWVARCPAHEDRRPSLSIRQTEDGRWLVYCFAGCGGEEIRAALGVDWSAFFPDSIRSATTDDGRRGRRHRQRPAPPIPASDALRLLEAEAFVVEIVAHRLSAGEPVEEHADALATASSRIGAVRRAWELRP